MSLRREKIDPTYEDLSVLKQCKLLSVPRSSYYYTPVPETEFNLNLMGLIDRQYMKTPTYGRRCMTAHLTRLGHTVNEKRTARLMRLMGIEAIYPKPKRENWKNKHGKFPYLLKGVDIDAVNKVWATDITYIPVHGGFLYLAAIIDLYSRYVIDWEISNNLESGFCLTVAERAFEKGCPEIFNTDQGVQYTSHGHIDLLKSKGVQISMSGKGRCWDNIFIERFWRSLKYEEVYINAYEDSEDAIDGIGSYIAMYNNERLHSSLEYKPPREVFFAA